MGLVAPVPVAIRNSQMRAIEIRMRSRQLAKLLEIDPGSFSGREEPACIIMALLTLMPSVRDYDKRRAFGNEILQNGDQILPSTSPENYNFWSYVRPLVGDMILIREWYSLFSDSAEELICKYWWLDIEVKVLGWAGMGSATSPVGGTVKSGLQAAQKAWPQGVRAATVAGARGIGTGAVRSLTGGMTGRFVPVWVFGSFAYWQGTKYRDTIRRELQRRYQERRLTPEQYQRALGADEPLPAPYLYKLRR